MCDATKAIDYKSRAPINCFLQFINDMLTGTHRQTRMVHVIFLSAWLVNAPPSTQNTFLTSCAWFHELSTERFGSLPYAQNLFMNDITGCMQAVIIFRAIIATPCNYRTHCMQYFCKSFFLCFALISYSDGFTLKRKTGMPYLSTTLGSISQCCFQMRWLRQWPAMPTCEPKK